MDNKITENDFEEIYKTKIEPNIRSLEAYRLEQKKEYDKYFKIAMIGLAGFFAMFISPFLFPFSIIAIVICCVFTTKYFKISKKFKEEIKPNLLKPILSCFGNFKRVKEEIISLKEINSFGFYPFANKQNDDDVIVGEYKNIPISLIETELTHTSNGEHSSTITDFKGLILKIKMNKRFSGITIGTQKVSLDNFIKSYKVFSQKNPELLPPEKIKCFDNAAVKTVSQLQKFISDTNINVFKINTMSLLKKNGLEKIMLEDSEFNTSYEIYSDSQIESRYLLTPSFMERLKNIQIMLFCTSINFIFIDEFVYLFLDGTSTNLGMKDYGCIKAFGIQQRDYYRFTSDSGYGFFEVGDIKHTLIDKKIYKKVFEELVSIFSLVDYFKLDEKTGL